MASTVRKHFRASRTALAAVHNTKRSLAANFARDTPPRSSPQLTEWRRLWQLASAAYLDRQHRVLWWRILHGCVMCGAFSAYIGRATLQQACCPFACCCTPTQPQTISHMFLGCPVAATVVSWLCRLWQAMTGHTPDASVATILAASTPDGHCASDALLQTWHRLRLAVRHNMVCQLRCTYLGHPCIEISKLGLVLFALS